MGGTLSFALSHPLEPNVKTIKDLAVRDASVLLHYTEEQCTEILNFCYPNNKELVCISLEELLPICKEQNWDHI